MPAAALSRGLFTRGKRDYLIDRVAYGHVDNLSGLVNSTVSLFNNATDGTSLGVAGLAIIKGGTPGTIAIRLFRGTIGAFAGGASPLMVNAPAPWGQFFSGTDPSVVQSNPANILGIMPHRVGFDWFGASPLFVVLPGYSLVLGIDSTALFCVNFWYTQE